MKLNNAEAVVQTKRPLRARGIGYDTGFSFDGVIRRPFNHELVRRELQIIRDDLHCNAVRLIGNDLDRIEFAADLGLEIWFSPFPMEHDPEEVLKQGFRPLDVFAHLKWDAPVQWSARKYANDAHQVSVAQQH